MILKRHNNIDQLEEFMNRWVINNKDLIILSAEISTQYVARWKKDCQGIYTKVDDCGCITEYFDYLEH